MDETTHEESALHSKEELNKVNPQQLEAMRKNYINNRKKEIEVLKVDVEYYDLMLRYYSLTKEIAVHEEEAQKKADSKKFKKSLEI